MATLTLDEPDREGTVLPDVCMMCGRPAPDRRYMDFRRASWWSIVFCTLSLPLLLLMFGCLGMLGALFVVSVLRRAASRGMVFHVPMCQVHNQLTFVRFWGIPAAIALLILSGIIGSAIGGGGSEEWRVPNTFAGERDTVIIRRGPVARLGDALLIVAGVGLPVCIVVGVVLYRQHRPQARRITDFTITLDRVAPEFVQAYEESRKPAPIPIDATARWRGPGGSARPAPRSEDIREK
jgi:hypothetical protein